MNFLIVEDDPTMQQIIAGMIERLGYGTRIVADGREAIEACLAEPPTAVLMDVQMPRMDGLSATRELRRLQREQGMPGFPIIVTSAFYSPSDRAACFEAGADGFVTKPLMLAKLGAEIYRVVGRCESDAASTLRQWQREESPASTGRVA